MHICVICDQQNKDFAAQVRDNLIEHFPFDVHLIDHDTEDSDVDRAKELDSLIQNALTTIIIITPHSITERHITFSWAAAQLKRLPVIPLIKETIPDNTPFLTWHHLDFVEDTPWKMLIHQVRESTLSVLLLWLWDEKAETRRAVIEMITRLGDHRSVPALLERLYDTESEIRIAAIDLLGAFRDERAIPQLLILLRDKDKHVVEAAYAALRHYNPAQTGLT